MTAQDDVVISAGGVRKAYGPVQALDGVDLSVRRGEVFALLGPNGAGKTTLVEIMEGYRQRDAGDVRVLGVDPAHATRSFRERIGIVLQSPGILRFLTVAESIELYRGYFPHPRPLDEIIEVVGLEEKRNERVRRLSGGQQRRLDVAVGLAGDPELLFLDEPTTGFDPGARRDAWQIIRNLRAIGTSVLLTTHYMDEAEHLADRVAIIARGRVIAEGTPRQLVRERTIVRFRPGATMPPLYDGVSALPGDEGWVEIETADVTKLLHALTSWAVARGSQLDGLTVRHESLEDAYLRLTSQAVTREAADA